LGLLAADYQLVAATANASCCEKRNNAAITASRAQDLLGRKWQEVPFKSVVFRSLLFPYRKG
jgi:hypothetical protein